MELRVWVDESDIDQIAEKDEMDEQGILDEISEAIAEFCGQRYGIIINTETAE